VQLNEFSSRKLGSPLAAGYYPNVERFPFETAGHPGLAISGNASGCNKLCGSFWIHNISIGSTGVVEILASFEQICECFMPPLRGCVHFKM
jgi:hypothetical protein